MGLVLQGAVLILVTVWAGMLYRPARGLVVPMICIVVGTLLIAYGAPLSWGFRCAGGQ